MMEQLFHWFSQLSARQAWILFVVLAAAMTLIPYSKIIGLFFLQIVYRKPLHIHRFQYHFTDSVESHSEEESSTTMKSPAFLVKGSSMTFSWNVTGAYRIDLLPVGKRLRGNSATIVFDSVQLTYTLKAFGFFRPPVSSTIIIPGSDVYELDRPEISRAKLATERFPNMNKLPLTKTGATTAKMTKLKSRVQKLSVGSILFNPGKKESIQKKALTRKKKEMERFLNRSSFLTAYNFSTKKFPNQLK